MDPASAIENSSISTPDDFGLNRSPTRGILKKSLTIGNRKKNNESKVPIKRMTTGTINRSTRVTFSDKSKNLPICTVFEVEPIKYEDAPSPKGRSCACITF
jgi:hypothetical protein